MATITTKGKVDYLLVKTGNGWVKVGGSLFLLWSNSDYAMHRLVWFSLCKQALASKLEISVTHEDTSSIPTEIQLNASP